MRFLLFFLISNFVFSATLLANSCALNLDSITTSSVVSLDSVNNKSGMSIRVNGRVRRNAIQNNFFRFKPGLNKVRVTKRGECRKTYYVVFADNYFRRPYQNPSDLEELRFEKLIKNPVGVSNSAPTAKEIATSMEEATPAFSDDIDLGLVFLGQFIDHDLTANDQFQNGQSSNVASPINLRTPHLDLDHLYGYGPRAQPTYYSNRLFFKLAENNSDVVREGGVAIIVDKRDDITGLTLQIHIAFRKFHNSIVNDLLNGNPSSKLRGKARNYIFEMARNEMIGYYQGIVANEFAEALLGRKLNVRYQAISNIPVEFSAAAFRIGHTLVPNLVTVDSEGNQLSPTSTALRGEDRIVVPWDLLIGENAQKSARFDSRIARVMQTLFIPLAPKKPDEILMVGGNNANIGAGRVIDGVLHLDLVETNILRSREQGLPAGEEVLTSLSGVEYNPSIHGSTDLFSYVLNEAEANNFKYGTVGAYIFERTITGVLRDDENSILTRKYSRKDRNRFKKATLSGIINKIQN